MSELFSIAGRRALITGASQGIGRMIAAGYVDAGATVYVCSRNEEACRTLEKELSTHGRCIALPGDVSTEAGCRAIADALHGYEDRLDILVNNAGAAAMAPIDSFGDDVWDERAGGQPEGPVLPGPLSAAPAPGRLRPRRPGPGDQHRLHLGHCGCRTWTTTPTPRPRPPSTP